MLRQALARLFQTLSGRDEAEMRADGGVSAAGDQRTLGKRITDSSFVRSLPFWLPGFLLVGLFVYGAVIWNFIISLTDWGEGFFDIRPDYESFDFEMYSRFFERAFSGDKWLGVIPTEGPLEYWALRNTIVLMIVFTVVALALGLLLAILIDQGIRFENTVRTIYLLPMSLSFVVTAVFWSWLYNFQDGLVNTILRGSGLHWLSKELFGIPLAMNWLGDPAVKLGAVIFALVWQFSGYCMIVYLAGLRAIPSDQFEAAKVDGASTFVTYWKVIIPQLRSSTVSAAIVLMVFALKAFDFLFVMFGNTPGPSVDILALIMYREAFAKSNWAYGSAIATILFLGALAVIGPYLYRQYRAGEL